MKIVCFLHGRRRRRTLTLAKPSDPLRRVISLLCILLSISAGCDNTTGDASRVHQDEPASNFTGEKTKHHPNGQIAIVEAYSNGKLDGPTRVFRDDGSLGVEVYYRGNQRHGTLKRWYPSGQLESEEHWVNGNLHGSQTSWHENGKLKRDWSYVEGKAHGTGTKWDEEGNRLSVEVFENGTLVDAGQSDLSTGQE